MRISDWSSDVCSSDLKLHLFPRAVNLAVWLNVDVKPVMGRDKHQSFSHRHAFCIEERKLGNSTGKPGKGDRCLIKFLFQHRTCSVTELSATLRQQEYGPDRKHTRMNSSP